MRDVLTIIVIVVAVILAIRVVRRHFRGLRDTSVVIVYWLVIFIFAVVSIKLIRLNTMPDDVEKVVEKVSKEVGSSRFIRVTDKDEIQVLIGKDWVDISKISIINKLSEDITIEYDGEEIYLGKSGLRGTIEVLDKLGLLD